MSLSSESVRAGARAIPYIMFTNDDVETNTLTSKGKLTMTSTSNNNNNNNNNSRTFHTSATTATSTKLCSLGYGVDDTDDIDDVYCNGGNSRSNYTNETNNNKKRSVSNASKKTSKGKNNKRDVSSSESSVKRNSNGYKVKRVIFPLMASYESEFMRACLQGLLSYPGFESSLVGKRCDPKSTCKTVGKEKSNVPMSSTVNGSSPSLQTELCNDKSNKTHLNVMKGTSSKTGHLISENQLTHSHSNFNDEVDDNKNYNKNSKHVLSMQHKEHHTQYEPYHTEHSKEEEEDDEPTTSLLMYGNEQLEEEEEIHLHNPVPLQFASTRRGDLRHNHALSELSQQEKEEEEQEQEEKEKQKLQKCKLPKEKETELLLEEEEEQEQRQLISPYKSKEENAFLQREKEIQSVQVESGCGLTTNVVSSNTNNYLRGWQEQFENANNAISITFNSNNNSKSGKHNVITDSSDNKTKSKNNQNVTVNKYITKCKEALKVSRSDLNAETNIVSTFANNAVESLSSKRVANERKHIPYAQMTDFATGNLFTSASLATNPTSPSSLIVREIDGGIRNHWGTQITTHASMCYRDYVLQSQAWLKRHINSVNNSKNKSTDALCHLELNSNVSTNSATPTASVHLQCVPVGSAEMDVAIRNEANYGTTDLQNIYFTPVNTPQITQWNVQRVCNDELMEEEEDYDSWSSNHVRCMPNFPFPQLTSFVLVQLVEYLVRRSAMELNEFQTIDICTDVLGPASSVKDASPEAQQRMIQRAKRLLLAASFLQM